LAGSRDLFKPELLAPEIVADLIGPRVRLPQAYWISPTCGDRYHDFLQDEPGDRRTAVMAEALRDEFGTRFEPLLVLADLLDETMHDDQRASPDTAFDRRSQLTVLGEILACGHVRDLHLHGLALPSKADPDGSWAVPAGILPGAVRNRIERLRAAVAAHMESDAVEAHVMEVTPDLPAFNTLYNNAICAQFAYRLEPRLLELGWSSDSEELALAISEILSDWNAKGIFLGLPLLPAHLDRMTELLYKNLLRI